MLEADRNADQAIADARSSPRFCADAAVGGRRRMRDRALRIAEVGRDGNHARGIYDPPGTLLATLRFERDDGAATFLLCHGKRVLGMRGQARIENTCDTRLLFQPL